MTSTPVQFGLRLAARFLLATFLIGLFVGGAQSVAVGLFPEPWDKVAHMAAFGSLAVLVELAFLPSAWLLIALPLLVSAADEFHQIYLPGRYPRLDDLLAGAVGVGMAFYLLRRTGVRRFVQLLHG